MWSQTYNLTETLANFRIGVKLETLSSNAPLFAQEDYQLTYCLFADENTTVETSFGGFTIGPYYFGGSGNLYFSGQFGETPTPGLTPFSFGQEGPGIAFGGQSNSLAAEEQIRLRGLSVNGVSLNTDGLSQGTLLGIGSGGANLNGVGTGSASAGAPIQIAVDIDISQFGGDTTAARITDTYKTVQQLHGDGSQKSPQADYLTCPVSESYAIPVQSWETHQKSAPAYWQYTVQNAWAQAYTFRGVAAPWLNTDYAVPIWQPAPRLFGSGPASGYYQPVSLTLAASLNVHRPDGNTPSSFVTSDGAKLTVSEGANSTVFQVAATGATATRTLAEDWRTWIADSAQPVDAYTYTDHNSLGSTNQDIWCWDSYSYLRCTIDAPAAVSLTLTVTGVYLDVTDSHTTGSDRRTDMTQVEVPWTRTYTLSLQSGTNISDVDLLFPNEGTGPLVGYGRVDTIAFSGFAVGDYTVRGLSLVATEQGYLKCDFGPPAQRGDYSALWLAQDGAAVLGAWPDTAYKPDETGTYGGGLRYVEPLTGSMTGTIQDSQLSVETFWTYPNRWEGWTTIYSQAAEDAANEDNQGNSIGGGIAQWTRPIVPHERFRPGQAYQPKVQPVVARVVPTAGRTYTLYSRWNAGHGAIEALVKEEGGNGRLGPGETFSFTDPPTGIVLGTGETDESSYVVVTPLPANDSITYRTIDEQNVIRLLSLNPHDHPRMLGVFGSPGGGVDLLELENGWLFRSYVASGDVWVERSKDAGVTWVAFKAAEDGAGSATPSLASRGLDLWVWYHDRDRAARACLSRDLGETWEVWASHSDLRWPRAVFRPEAMYLIGYGVPPGGSDNRLAFYRSKSEGVSLESYLGNFQGAAAVSPALRVDRNGILRVYHETTSGTIVHYWGEDGSTWTGPEIIATGSKPAVTLYDTAGALCFYQGTDLQVVMLDHGYATQREATTTPSISPPYRRQTHGILIHRRDDLRLDGKVSQSILSHQWSPDDGATWGTPT